jgi:hypothetical protein
LTHVERVMKAFRFGKPDCLPLEIHDVPRLYDAYDTLDPATVRPVPGTGSFDSLRVTYHWTFTEEGRNEAGERLRRDEWGCLQRVPAEKQTAYQVLENPLAEPEALDGYVFPDPSVSDPFFERIEGVIRAHYADRFVCGYVDPGPLLVAFNLLGYDSLLTRLVDDPDQVLEIVAQIVQFQQGIIDRFAAIGVHMVAIIDEFAGTHGLMFSPKLWREQFAPIYEGIFRHIRSHGLLAGCLFDGDITAILDDCLALGLDVVEIVQPNLVGIETWSEKLRGKIASKASVDMMTTLATGSPNACRAEARRLVEALTTPEGGFMGISLRWHRPEYPAGNVLAVAEALNEYRACAL